MSFKNNFERFLPVARILIIPAIWLLFYACSSASNDKLTDEDRSQTAFAYYYQAGNQIENGRFKEALANLDSAIIRRPKYANFYQVKGWVLEQVDSVDGAVAAYEKCLQINSNAPDVQLRLGRLYLKQEIFERAAFYLRKSSLAMPDSQVILLDLSEAYVRMNRESLAIDQLNLYEKRNRHTAPVYYKLLGMARYHQNRYQKRRQPSSPMSPGKMRIPKVGNILDWPGLPSVILTSQFPI